MSAIGKPGIRQGEVAILLEDLCSFAVFGRSVCIRQRSGKGGRDPTTDDVQVAGLSCGTMEPVVIHLGGYTSDQRDVSNVDVIAVQVIGRRELRIYFLNCGLHELQRALGLNVTVIVKKSLGINGKGDLVLVRFRRGRLFIIGGRILIDGHVIVRLKQSSDSAQVNKDSAR